MKHPGVLIVAAFTCSGYLEAHELDHTPAASTAARQATSGGGDGLRLQLLLSFETIGSDGLEIAHLTLPGGDGVTCANKPCQAHQHPVDEIMFVLQGQLEHVVEGDAQIIAPGMLAVAPRNRNVAHNVLSEEPLEVLIVWPATGEFDRLVRHYGWSETMIPRSESDH